MNYKTFSLAVALLGFTIAFLKAQTGPDTHFFRALAWQTPIKDLYYSQEPPPIDPNTGAPAAIDQTASYPEQPIDIPTAFRSNPYKFSPSKQIYFLRHVNSRRITVATVDTQNEPILPLLFFQQDLASHNYVVTVIPDNKDRFPGGSFRIFNFSHLATNVVLGGKAVTLQPKESCLLSPTLTQNAVHLNISLANGQGVYTNNLRCLPDYRFILFLINNPKDVNSVIFLRLVDSTNNAVEPTPPPGQ